MTGWLRLRSTRWFVVMVTVCVGASGWRISAAFAAQASSASTTRDGVYSAEQAERGQMVFDGKCRDCHTAAMWGSDWDTKSVGDVVDYISQDMPEPAPGTLSPAQTRDVVAFILKSNALPSGGAELPQELEAMKRIRMVK